MPRCPAKPWGPGGPSGPCGDTAWGFRGGGVVAQHPMMGGSPDIVPEGRPRQVRLSRRGDQQGLGDRGHRHGPGGRRRRERPWDRLCQRSRGGRGGPGYPGWDETQLVQTSGSSAFITRIPAPLGPLGRILDPHRDPGDPPLIPVLPPSDPSCPPSDPSSSPSVIPVAPQ